MEPVKVIVKLDRDNNRYKYIITEAETDNILHYMAIEWKNGGIKMLSNHGALNKAINHTLKVFNYDPVKTAVFVDGYDNTLNRLFN